MTRIRKRRLLELLLAPAALLALHWLLGLWMQRTGAAAVILSAGPHTPVHLMVLTGGFLLVRLVSILALPGFVAANLALLALDLRKQGVFTTENDGNDNG